ncbi:hypothetical protein GCM10011579_083850 [Streptomyces albiflavescens]|uniref:Dienelactone hydrolase domain-containing protein n=1 Tax=Streptomyces albiflavescens TaxID=1623582 RepID=A0A918DA15_9ACTN|nr:dienelactone hydrolase family protein [Streptomyces albiflavescens]GGN89236.1 hypothetical protein GCM10011579_083850 [Streptomyces albiflavescens]
MAAARRIAPSREDATDLAGSTAVGSAVAFVLLTLIVIGRDGAALFGDEDLTSWSVGHRPDVALAVARGVTYTGTGIVPYALAAVAGLVLGRTTRQRILAVVGCLGCLAAAQAVRYEVIYQAAADPRVSAAVPFYGVIQGELPDFSGLKAQILGHYGELDTTIPKESLEQLSAAIQQQSGITPDFRLYPAQHAFFNDGRPEAYAPESAAQAWESTVAFLHEQLG